MKEKRAKPRVPGGGQREPSKNVQWQRKEHEKDTFLWWLFKTPPTLYL